MPITKSAKKAFSRSEVLREVNNKFRLAMKNTMKLVKKAVDNNLRDNLPQLVQNAYSAIDRAAKKNIIHKNNAARKKSSIARLALISN